MRVVIKFVRTIMNVWKGIAKSIALIGEAYRRRELTKKAFCAQHGVPESVLTYWIAKYHREQATEAGSFVEISPSLPMAERALMEMIFPNGIMQDPQKVSQCSAALVAAPPYRRPARTMRKMSVEETTDVIIA
jgi:hypothetical protein